MLGAIVNLPPQRHISTEANNGKDLGVADNTQHSRITSRITGGILGATVATWRNRNFPASLPQRKIP